MSFAPVTTTTTSARTLRRALPWQIHNALFLQTVKGTQAAARYLRRLGYSAGVALFVLARV